MMNRLMMGIVGVCVSGCLPLIIESALHPHTAVIPIPGLASKEKSDAASENDRVVVEEASDDRSGD